MHKTVRAFFSLLLVFFSSSASALVVGNPANPKLYAPKCPRWGFVRFGYFTDWIYDQCLKDEFTLQGETTSTTHLRSLNYAGTFTFTLKERLEFYTQLGSAQIQFDNDLFCKRSFSWSIGGKLIVFRTENFFLGTDFKYLKTEQKPSFFLLDSLPYNVYGKYRLELEQIQAAVGVAYRIFMMVPYANLTYIDSHISPIPAIILVKLPDNTDIADVEMGSVVGEKKWGSALGLSLIDLAKVSLNFEWQALNQNGISFQLDFRF